MFITKDDPCNIVVDKTWYKLEFASLSIEKSKNRFKNILTVNAKLVAVRFEWYGAI